MNKRIFWAVVGLHLIFGCVPAPGGPEQSGEDDAGGVVDDVFSGDAFNDAEGTDLEGGWRWLSVEGTRCGNGTETGMGVSEGTDPKQLVVMLAGGGACWDGASCYVFNAAANIETTYGQTHFEADLRTVTASGIVDRRSSPFAQANQVYIPYCTADLHAGDAIGSYDAFNPNRKVHHKGAVNMEIYLAEFKARWPEVEEIFVIGVSAGGYGAMLNLNRIKSAFPQAQVHVLADGSQMVQPLEGRWGMWRQSWALELPEDCDACVQRFPDLAGHIIETNPDSRIGLLAYEDDAVIAVFFAHGLDAIGAATRAVIRDHYDGPHARAFSRPGTEHVMLGGYHTLRDNEGMLLRDFVASWASGQDW